MCIRLPSQHNPPTYYIDCHTVRLLNCHFVPHFTTPAYVIVCAAAFSQPTDRQTDRPIDHPASINSAELNSTRCSSAHFTTLLLALPLCGIQLMMVECVDMQMKRKRSLKVLKMATKCGKRDKLSMCHTPNGRTKIHGCVCVCGK